jgi:subtilase family serine protease
MENGDYTLSAEVVLRSRTGRSLSDENVAITSNNIEEFSPSDDTIKEATCRLQDMGFSVAATGVTLTIVGKLSLFEEVFSTKITLGKTSANDNIIIHCEKDPIIPSTLRDIIEKIIFIPPPIYLR